MDERFLLLLKAVGIDIFRKIANLSLRRHDYITTEPLMR